MKDQNPIEPQPEQAAPQSTSGLSYPAVSFPIQRKVNRVSSGKGSADLHDHGSAAKLFNLEVDPAKRGQGAGKELLKQAAQTALVQGKKKLVLDSQDEGSGKLDNWYKTQGFKSTGKNNGMNSFEMPLQRKEANAASSSINNQSSFSKPPLQLKSTNRTGLPDGLKTKMESTFGTDLSNVRVNKNSSLPGKVGAIATTRGNRIDFAPGHYNPASSKGQQLIGHETWHTVQQAQGRVKPTLQMKTGYLINDSEKLEREADVMGDRVVHANSVSQAPVFQQNPIPDWGKQHPIQRSVGFELQTHLPALKPDGSFYAEDDYGTLLYEVEGKLSAKEDKSDIFHIEIDHTNKTWQKETGRPIESVVEIVTKHQPSKKATATVLDEVDEFYQQVIKVTDMAKKQVPLSEIDKAYVASSKMPGLKTKVEVAGTLIGNDPKSKTPGSPDQISIDGQMTFGIPLKSLAKVLPNVLKVGTTIPDKFVKKQLLPIFVDADKICSEAPSAQGLITLILLYMKIMGQLPEGSYPKAGAVFMARTDFHSMFKTLPDNEKDVFLKLLQTTMGVQKMDPKKRVLKHEFETHDDETVTSPTREEWIDSIVNPPKKLDKWDVALTDGTDEQKAEIAQKDLMSRSTVRSASGPMGVREVAEKGQEANMAILEYRGMDRKYIPKKPGDLSKRFLAFFDAVAEEKKED